MPIEFTCSGCGKKMKTADVNAGKKGKCPKCGAKVDIPLPGLPTREPPQQTQQPPPESPKPAAPSVPTSPAPTSPASAPPSKGPETDLFGAAARSTVSWDANQDFLSELAGPASDAASPLGGTGNVEGGAAAPQPAPTYAPPPSYAPPPAAANPYASYAPAYGSAPRKSETDMPGVFGLILGLVSILTIMLGCVFSMAFFPPGLIITALTNLVMSVAGLVLGFNAKGGLRTASLLLNGVMLGAVLLVLAVVVLLVLLGVGIYAASRQ